MKTLKTRYKVIYQIVYTLLGWAVRLLYPLRVLGRENLIKGSGFVLASNHLRAIDPLYILLARGFGKRMLIIAKDELFHINGFINWCWKVFGAFPIDRGTGDRGMLDQAMAEVRDHGTGFLIFPEGTRSKDGNLGKMKSGAFVVAMEAGVPIVPCVIRYSAGKAKLFRRIGVAFGKPVSMEELGLTGEYSVKKIREAKRIYTETMQRLIEETKDRL
ncbi:1-acyl-sn-glycerol-3-phosphate acyltransferase [Ruminococcaceae bacterium OttesenSCG-928-D13]|nr:1-acyl-sn-glycerol-3-phosphate acyltransferase [Ruminococcaceae bacterium OttesenSCG-928-D13]